MGGTKRQECEEFVANEMNTDTLAYILTMALEATRLELERTHMELEDMELEDLRSRQEQERRRIFTGTADAEIARSRERIFRLVAMDL